MARLMDEYDAHIVEVYDDRSKGTVCVWVRVWWECSALLPVASSQVTVKAAKAETLAKIEAQFEGFDST